MKMDLISKIMLVAGKVLRNQPINIGIECQDKVNMETQTNHSTSSDNESQRNRIAFLVIMVAAFFVRILLIHMVGTDGTSYESVEIAMNLVNGNGFSYDAFPPKTGIQETCFIAPFYPFFIAFFFVLFGTNALALQFLLFSQALIGSLTVYVIYSIANQVYDGKTTMIASLVVAFHPDFIYSVVVIHHLVFSTLFFVLIVKYSWALHSEPSKKSATYAGLAYGIALHIEPIFIVVILPFFIWELGYTMQARRLTISSPNPRHLRYVFIAAILCSMIILPWESRCISLSEGSPIFLKDTGFNLWRGNNPEYTETGVPTWYDVNLLNQINSTNEIEIDTAFGEIAWNYMFTHVSETVNNVFRKISDYWWYTSSVPEQNPLIRQLIYVPLLLSALMHIMMNRKDPFAVFLSVAFVFFSIPYFVGFALPRHRVPIQPLLFLLSSKFLVDITSKFQQIEERRQDTYIIKS